MPGTRRCSRSERRLLDVEVVERHDTVDADAPRQVAGPEDQVVEPPALVVVGHIEDVVEALARPVGVAQAFRRDQEDARALALRLAEEVVPLVIRGDAEDGERCGHAGPDGGGLHATIGRVSVFDERPTAAPAARRWPIAVAAILLAVGGAVWLTQRRRGPRAGRACTDRAGTLDRARPGRASRPRRAAEPAAPVAKRPAGPSAPTASTPAPPAAPRADAATLVVESDVPGASVFVDRQFVGTAPVTLKDLAPGAKRINLSAEGFDGISRTVELAPGGQTVNMRFKEVRLDASTAVAHKHGVGDGCEGTLRATVDGLTYETGNKSDAFALRFDQVETFEVNYLEKNLRVKQRGGKTWNFTDRNAENADRLFVFHRDVEAARAKLAKGYAAAR